MINALDKDDQTPAVTIECSNLAVSSWATQVGVTVKKNIPK